MFLSDEDQPGPPENYGSFFDIDTALRGQGGDRRRILQNTIASFDLAPRKNERTEAVTVRAHVALLERLLEWNYIVDGDKIGEGFSELHTAGGSLSLYDARVREDDGRDKTYRQTTHFSRFVNWSRKNAKLFDEGAEGKVGAREGIIKPDGGISASVVCKFDGIDMPTLVNSSEPVMEPNESLASFSRVSAGLRTQYELDNNQVLYHIVCIVIEIKPPTIPETHLIGQISCYAGGLHDVCGTSYGYAGRGSKAYRLLVLDNAIVFEGPSDRVEVFENFNLLAEGLKDGSVEVGRSLLLEDRDEKGKKGLDEDLVKDIRKLFVAAIEQLKEIRCDRQPLKRLPSPEGPTWTALRDRVKTATIKNAVTEPEPLFEAARLSKKKIAQLRELHKRKEESASAGNAESGPRAEDSEFVAPPPEGAESTEVNADAQPGTDDNPKKPKGNGRKTKQRSVNDPAPKIRRNRSRSPGGGGQGPKERRATRSRAAQAGPSATTSSATKEGGQRGRGSGRGAKTADRTVGHKVGKNRESNGNATDVLKGKDSFESASSQVTEPFQNFLSSQLDLPMKNPDREPRRSVRHASSATSSSNVPSATHPGAGGFNNAALGPMGGDGRSIGEGDDGKEEDGKAAPGTPAPAMPNEALHNFFQGLLANRGKTGGSAAGTPRKGTSAEGAGEGK
ncbi:hypothetical protein L202_08475 [Cryptococcus amylolentus CBS 6039]|uniref:Uncharacterized protein n=1 Tax=Cryptococcus amylolentus CBS 6039 TaxID=1295533 RepID=A0A1E3HCA9_9TREE|nr:hypothetical protein L202_08475 [Cryptococcus amylolentus CBS 6039]ODN73081.1 hypothetical protein L202_08475 [Cryptococcus amylolentus CBS 6039]